MILDGLRKFFLARFFATFFFHQGYYKQKGTKQCSGRNRAVRLPGTEEKGMKKNAKRIVALGIAGILLLTGCGGKADTSSPAGADGTTRQEAPSEAAWELPEADFGNAEGTTADSGMESPSESAAVENAADAADGMLMEEEMDGAAGRYADIAETPQNSYSKGSAADEWKMEGAEELNEDLYAKGDAPDGYLGSCYEFDEEIDNRSNQEEYSKWKEQGFFSVMEQPLSTFSADVDTASYSNLRRLIREGYDLESLPEGAARIEEMVNYFSYDYEGPRGQEPFGVTTQIGCCPWNDEAELLMVGLKTEDISYDQAPASNLVFLLDVSGSMGEPDKLPLLQEAFAELTDNLSSKDRISIVTYASEDTIVLEGAVGSEKRKIKKALNGLQAGGGTWGSRGIETAYELAEENFIRGGNNRIVLATDGDLNIGMTTEEELEELISEKKESGIFLSVLGFGTDNIKDNKMETLADKGNGNYAYIDCMQEAKKVLSEEMTATLLTVCKDVKLQVEFNPEQVEAYRLLGYDNRVLDREDFHDDTKDGGEIGAGHSVTALYEIILREPLQHKLPGMTEREIDDLKYGSEYRKRAEEMPASGSKYREWLTVSIRYKKPAGSKSELLEYPIGYDSYRENPSNDFLFAAAVAEFGLLASHSEYPEDASVEHVERTVRKLDLKDSYKAEFLELVKEVQ
jgi:Ca-activated chloride channel family protein